MYNKTDISPHDSPHKDPHQYNGEVIDNQQDSIIKSNGKKIYLECSLMQ